MYLFIHSTVTEFLFLGGLLCHQLLENGLHWSYIQQWGNWHRKETGQEGVRQDSLQAVGQQTMYWY